MRILVLAPHPFFVERGTPIDTDLLLRALSRRGDRVHVVTYPEGEERRYEGVTIHRPEGPGWLRDIRPGFSLKKLVADILVIRSAARLLRRMRFDVIHATEEGVFMAMAFGRRHGVPYVYDMDSSVAQQMVEQFPWLSPLASVLDAIEGLALRRCAAAAPVCNALAELAERRGAPHVVTLHDISQLDDPDRAPAGLLAERWGVRRPAVVYVGNLEPYQGVDLLVDAVEIAVERGSGLDLVVAGGRPDAVEAHRRDAEGRGLADRIHFVGPWPNDRLDELLAEASILVAPRIRGVNTPMKIFPYLHSGKPLLATDLPTHTQLLDSSVAMLAPPEPGGFADALLRLEEDPGLRERLGRAGRRFVEENHTFEAHQRRVNRLYAYLERLGAGSRPPARTG